MVKYKLVAGVISTALLLTACGNAQPQVVADAPKEESQNIEQNKESSNGESGNAQPQVAAGAPKQESQNIEQNKESSNGESGNNAGQNQRREQEAADVYGRVKSIIGNEVVLEVAEMPQRGEGQGGSGQVRTGQGGGNALAVNQGGQIPPGGGAPMGGGQGQRSGIQREIKLTGEILTLLIPVGVPINSFGQGGMKELDIADIYEGMMMQLWYDKNDEASKSIIRVMVMQGR